MGYQKIKVEEYKNIGGINGKASVYVTGEKEVLDLVNFDFSKPGAWTKRPGLTFPLANNGIAPGVSFRFSFGFQTLINDGANNSYVTYLVGTSAVLNVKLFNTYEYATIPIYVAAGSSVKFALGACTTGIGNYTTIMGKLGNNVTGLDSSRAYWAADGYIYKSPGYYIGLPRMEYTYSTADVAGGGLGGPSTFYFRVAPIDASGHIGPPGTTFSFTTTGANKYIDISGFTFTQQAIDSGVYGFVLYRTLVSGYSADSLVASDMLVSGSGVTLRISSSPGAGSTIVGQSPKTTVSNLVPAGFTPDSEFYSSWGNAVEYWNGRLWIFYAGGSNRYSFSNLISEDAFVAEDFEPESYGFINNENYPMIGGKAYNQSLIIFLQKGVYRLTGDYFPFNVQTINVEYGALNIRAVVLWQQRIWFLDDKSIVEFDGSGCKSVSNRVSHILNRMNVTAAMNSSWAYHYEDRNEVWFGLPLDGATQVNTILVYDYLADSWTTFSSADLPAIDYVTDFFEYEFKTGFQTPQPLRKKNYWFGINGNIRIFDASLPRDWTTAMTCSVTTRFHAEQGHSVTDLWRRLYVDTGAFAGTSFQISANFYTNFATSTIAMTRTIYFNGSTYSGKQQTRIDFGLPAKALGMKMSYSATLPLSIYGYTIERRFLRNV